jgi:hypothetical protein
MILEAPNGALQRSCSERLRADACRAQSRKDESRSQHDEHNDLRDDTCANDASRDAGETDREHVGTDACSAQSESGKTISPIKQIQDSDKGDGHSRAKEPDLGDGARREPERRGHVEYAQGQNRGAKYGVKDLHDIKYQSTAAPMQTVPDS